MLKKVVPTKQKGYYMKDKKLIDVTDCHYLGQKENKEKYPEEVFSYILKETPFKNYAKEIFEALLSIKSGDISLMEEETMQRKKEHFLKLKDIAESLLICKTNKEWGIYSGNRKSHLPSPLNEEMEKRLEEMYIEESLNQEPMTFEEGKTILEFEILGGNHEFVDEYWEMYAEESGLTDEEKAGGYTYDIEDDMVEMYIENKYVSRDITKEQIMKKLSFIKQAIKRNTCKGAPKKNLRLHCAINIFQQKKEYHSCNSTYRTIYQCLDFLELINEKQKLQWKKTISAHPEIPYIKSLCKEAAKYQAEIYPF